MPKIIGITGSRSVFPTAAAARWLGDFAGDSPRILVGDAPGVDSWALDRFPGCCQVFRRAGNKKYHFARRSIEMAESLAAIPGAILIGFPDKFTPEGLFPSPRSRDCFNGSGSGTWATMAYAAGLGIPVFFIGFTDCSYPWGSLHSRLNDCQSVYFVTQCQPTQCELL